MSSFINKISSRFKKSPTPVQPPPPQSIPVLSQRNIQGLTNFQTAFREKSEVRDKETCDMIAEYTDKIGNLPTPQIPIIPKDEISESLKLFKNLIPEAFKAETRTRIRTYNPRGPSEPRSMRYNRQTGGSKRRVKTRKHHYRKKTCKQYKKYKLKNKK